MTTTPALPAPRFSAMRALLCAAGVVAATVLAYSNSFSGVFLFDDINVIVLAPPSFQPAGWYLRFFSNAGGGRLVQLSLVCNHALGGLSTAGYHAFNLAVHVLSALAVFGLIRRTVQVSERLAAFRPHADALALACAVIFAIHPLQTESVTYIVQRAQAMMGLFHLAGLCCFVIGFSSTVKAPWYAAAVLLNAAALDCKPHTVTAIVIILLFDWTFLSQSIGGMWRKTRWAHAALILLWAVSVGPLVLRVAGAAPGELDEGTGPLAMAPAQPAPKQGDAAAPVAPVTPAAPVEPAAPPQPLITRWQYAQSELPVVLYYLRLSFWPQPLCIDYAWPVANGPGDVAFSGVIVALLLLATAWALWKWRALGFLMAAFFLCLAPTSSLIPRPDLLVEHRMYLPLLPLVVMFVFGVCKGWRWMREHGGEIPAPLLALVFVVLAAALACMTFARNKDYASRLAMWESVVRHRPDNARGHYSYGNVLEESGDLDGARRQYQTAIDINPYFIGARQGLAFVLASKGDMAGAEQQYIEAVRYGPRTLINYVDLAWLYMRTGRVARARETLARAQEIDANDPNVLYTLGQMHEREGHFDKAVAAYRAALRVNGDALTTGKALGLALAKTDLPAAIDVYAGLSAAHPADAEVRFNHAALLANAGRHSEACDEFRAALKNDEAFVEAYVGLAESQRALKQFAAARDSLNAALRLRPGDAAIQRRLSTF